MAIIKPIPVIMPHHIHFHPIDPILYPTLPYPPPPLSLYTFHAHFHTHSHAYLCQPFTIPLTTFSLSTPHTFHIHQNLSYSYSSSTSHSCAWSLLRTTTLITFPPLQYLAYLFFPSPPHLYNFIPIEPVFLSSPMSLYQIQTSSHAPFVPIMLVHHPY